MHPKFVAYALVSPPQTTKSAGLVTVEAAWRPASSVLLVTISHIVGLCAEPEVVRIYARRGVAGVTNEQSSRYFSVAQTPAYAMRIGLALISV